MMQPPLKIIGIDPGLAHCGLVALHWHGRQAYEVSQYRLIETEADDGILQRMRTVHDDVRRFLLDQAPFAAIVVESPIKKSGRRGRTVKAKSQFKSPHDISAQGIATGVELAAALDFVGDVAFIDADDWMPKTQTGRFTHTIKHEQLVVWLRSAIRFPVSMQLKKHVHCVMAAGVARYWCEMTRFDTAVREGRLI